MILLFVRKLIFEIYKFFVPHFFTDLFAINIDDAGDWTIYCPARFIIIEKDVDKYEYYGRITGFTWLGIGMNLHLTDVYDLDGNLMTEDEE